MDRFLREVNFDAEADEDEQKLQAAPTPDNLDVPVSHGKHYGEHLLEIKDNVVVVGLLLLLEQLNLTMQL